MIFTFKFRKKIVSLNLVIDMEKWFLTGCHYNYNVECIYNFMRLSKFFAKYNNNITNNIHYATIVLCDRVWSIVYHILWIHHFFFSIIYSLLCKIVIAICVWKCMVLELLLAMLSNQSKAISNNFWLLSFYLFIIWW